MRHDHSISVQVSAVPEMVQLVKALARAAAARDIAAARKKESPCANGDLRPVQLGASE